MLAALSKMTQRLSRSQFNNHRGSTRPGWWRYGRSFWRFGGVSKARDQGRRLSELSSKYTPFGIDSVTASQGGSMDFWSTKWAKLMSAAMLGATPYFIYSSATEAHLV